MFPVNVFPKRGSSGGLDNSAFSWFWKICEDDIVENIPRLADNEESPEAKKVYWTRRVNFLESIMEEENRSVKYFRTDHATMP